MKGDQLGDECGSESGILTPNRGNSSIEFEVGMEFSTVDDIESLYAEYAKNIGFTIIRRNSRAKSVQFYCYKEGMPRVRNRSRSNDRVESSNFVRSSKSNKVGCRACLYITLMPSTKTWRISKFEDLHNHEMVSPKSLKYPHRHKKLTGSAKCLSQVFENSGIPVGKVSDVLYSISKEAEFSRKDVYNYMGQVRKSILDVGDAQAVYTWCSHQQELNPNFRYSIQMDESDRMTNFFWIDARSRRAYVIFGDYVSFDTTYRTNKYNMPFASFVGIDNHLHTMLFGCALIQDEREDTFVWLFESWLHAIDGKEPKGFITDQDMTIMNAATKVFPHSRHRLCGWHINKKFPERLPHIYHERSKFKADLNGCIYGLKTIVQFEQSWEMLVQEYNLTGRSESINAFFDAFVHSGTTLTAFIGKFGQAMDRCYETFHKAEFDSRHKVPTLTLGMGLEEHASSIYIGKVFKMFHSELKKILSYTREIIFQNDTIRTYKVTNRMDKNDAVMVQFDGHSIEFLCECKLFESIGILCGHALAILFEHSVEKIPSKYILHRWTKDAGRELWDHSVARTTVTTLGIRSLSYKKFFDDLSFMGDSSESIHETILKGLDDFTQIMRERFERIHTNDHIGSSTTPQEIFGMSESDSRVHVRDPNITVTKGRKKTRIRSGIEISNDIRVRCSVCQIQGHNLRTCPSTRLSNL